MAWHRLALLFVLHNLAVGAMAMVVRLAVYQREEHVEAIREALTWTLGGIPLAVLAALVARQTPSLLHGLDRLAWKWGFGFNGPRPPAPLSPAGFGFAAAFWSFVLGMLAVMLYSSWMRWGTAWFAASAITGLPAAVLMSATLTIHSIWVRHRYRDGDRLRQSNEPAVPPALP